MAPGVGPSHAVESRTTAGPVAGLEIVTVDPLGATAVVANVTVVPASKPGFLTSFRPAVRPSASTLNVAALEVTSNRVMTGLSSSGRLSIVASAQTHVVVDVVGYYLAGFGKVFTLLTPVRMLDTRVAVGVVTRTPIPSGSTTMVQLAGRGEPANSKAVALTLTGTGSTRTGFLTAWSGAPPGLWRRT